MSPSPADPFIGTFALNAAKSKMSGARAVVEGTLIITEDGDHLVVTPSFKTTDGPVRAGRLVVPKAGGVRDAREPEHDSGRDVASRTERRDGPAYAQPGWQDAQSIN
jgi:hypothetical protein